jgi:hypothetical protein
MEAWSEYEHSRHGRPALGPALAKRGLRPSIAVLSARMGLRHPHTAVSHGRATLTSEQLPRPGMVVV